MFVFISLKSRTISLKPLRMDKWLKSKVKEIALSILNNHLICIDSLLCSISKPLSTFELQPAFYSSFGIARSFYYGLSHIRSTACAFECHLKTPTTTSPSALLPFHFVCGYHHFHPNILCARNTLISSLQKWKLRLWRCTSSLKCQALRPEYQSLAFDACCWTSIVPLVPVVAAHLRFGKALWGQHISSEVTHVSH